jgi:cell division protein FtsL
MYLSYAAGILTWLIISVVQVIGLKNSNRKLVKENKKVQDELNRLRNVTIEEETESSSDVE